ncbi:MAG: hypothetical protein CMI54_00195 [Parcubacteria group bacterium]|nr:hypothetical protein [Parcubacteria group bacterium]|tara:strand:- start:15682 stop:16056 length:375 start_codon:yes stop_codon:yes gene_type:complete
MSAENVDFNITQGSVFNVRIQVFDSAANIIDLTGNEVRGVVKNKYSDPDTDILINLDPIVSDATKGEIDILLTSAQTAQLPVTEARYDLEKYPLTNTQGTEKLLEGRVLIHPEITSGVDLDYNS